MSAAAMSVYLLCLLTGIACAWLLVRSYLCSRTKLLLWSAACFVGLALNNLLVVADVVMFPSFDFAVLRTLSALLAVSVLIYGFIWELD
jgi:hypothetical protein